MHNLSEMTTVELIAAMADPDFPAPLTLLREAIKRKPKLEPLFVDFCHELCANPSGYANRAIDSSNFHICTFYLLAQWRSQQIFDDLLYLLQQDFSTIYEIFGDHLTCGLPSIIASVYDFKETRIRDLADVMDNRSQGILVRVASLNALFILHNQQLIQRDQLVKALMCSVENAIEKRDEFINELVLHIANHKIEELIPLVTKAFSESVVDTDEYPKSQINDYFNNPAPAMTDDSLVDDAIEELKSWPNFNESSFTVLEHLEELCELQCQSSFETNDGRSSALPFSKVTRLV